MSVATALLGYLQTAAATMSAPECTQVGGGEPDVVNVPTLAFWASGPETWEANTFTYTQEYSSWHIRGYLPVSARFTPASAAAEDWIVALGDAIRGQLYGHVSMGGEATGGGMELTDSKTGWAQIGNQLCRVIDMDCRAMMANVHVIAH